MRVTLPTPTGHRPARTRALATVGVAVLALAAGCGSAAGGERSGRSSSETTATAAASSSPSPSADTSLGHGRWLLGIATAGGADGETTITTYVTYDPSTGAAAATRLPGFKAASADSDDAPLLVSGDRRWAIPDTGLTKDEETSGRLTLYSLPGAHPRTLDVRQRTGDASLHPLGWAFDPSRPATLRVVDARSRVWTVDVAGGRARQTGTLAKGPWIFTNGFNHNTGEPYVESIESSATKPAGNGQTDTSAVERARGVVLASDSKALAALPKSPCRLAGGFTDAHRTTWEFCADSATLRAYYLAPGSSDWVAFGKPSPRVAPIAAAFPLVLPPAA